MGRPSMRPVAADHQHVRASHQLTTTASGWTTWATAGEATSKRRPVNAFGSPDGIGRSREACLTAPPSSERAFDHGNCLIQWSEVMGESGVRDSDQDPVLAADRLREIESHLAGLMKALRGSAIGGRFVWRKPQLAGLEDIGHQTSIAARGPAASRVPKNRRGVGLSPAFWAAFPVVGQTTIIDHLIQPAVAGCPTLTAYRSLSHAVAACLMRPQTEHGSSRRRSNGESPATDAATLG